MHLFDKFQGELEHRRGKRFFKRVRKGKHILGIGLQVRRERIIHKLQERNKRIQERLNKQRQPLTKDDLPTVPFEDHTETLPPTAPTQHYHISINSRQKVQLSQWLSRNEKDPAVHVSISVLISIPQLTQLFRTSYRASRTTFCHAFLATSMMATN